MQRNTLKRLLVTALGAIAVINASVYFQDTTALVVLACFVYVAICARLYKFDYLHPSVAYLVPWMMILSFSVVPLSKYSRPMNVATYELLLATIFAWLFGCVSANPEDLTRLATVQSDHRDLTDLRPNFKIVVIAAFMGLYMFAALNIAVAGYVPLLSLLTTGDSRYLDFGIPSVYGAFLAYANAVGCVAFYVYLRTKRTSYLLWFLSVLVMHVTLVTRQNIITLLVEIFVIRCLTLKRLSRFTMVLSLSAALGAFSLLGTLRSGDVKEIFGIQQDYMWVPTSFIWLYAYSYFNALNIDNTITQSGAPFFDGFMWQTLLPSLLRPQSNHETYLEVTSAAASSYIYPVYIDIGKGVVAWTGVLGFATAAAYRRALRRRRFLDVATYGCLFSCALLSFFTDFWLYLPVSFQLIFFWVFQRLLFLPHPARSTNALLPQLAGRSE
jgi:oligosaccharide repeat unit polymerase